MFAVFQACEWSTVHSSAEPFRIGNTCRRMMHYPVKANTCCEHFAIKTALTSSNSATVVDAINPGHCFFLVSAKEV